MTATLSETDTPVSLFLILSPRASVAPMEKALRRPRGAAKDMVQVNYMVPAECKQKLERVSKLMEMSGAQGLELILKHLELEADGLPAWADRTKTEESSLMAKTG